MAQGKWDWYHVKFLESTENLKALLGGSSQRIISTGLANDISVCLQQGRSFFELSELSPPEIRPLLLYYGMVGFAKAVALARSLKRLDTLDRTHGLSDVSDPKGSIENFTSRFNACGTFQAMNDSIRVLEKIHIHKRDEVKTLLKPTCSSDALAGKEISLKSVLGRIPHLEAQYEETFREPAKVVHCSHFEVEVGEGRNWIVFTTHHYNLPRGKKEFEQFLSDLRKKLPFLNEWCLVSAKWFDGAVSIVFANIDRNETSEFRGEELFEIGLGYETKNAAAIYDKDSTNEDITKKIGPISGNLMMGDTWIIEPHQDLTLSEMSLHYCGMFILSSLVRYHPSVWANALAKRARLNEQVDDRALPLIESFIKLTASRFPAMVANAIKEPFTNS